jgi:hypothetical protein
LARAFSVVNIHLMRAPAALRCCSQAAVTYITRALDDYENAGCESPVSSRSFVPGRSAARSGALQTRHELLSWLKTTEGLSYSEILAMRYGGVLNEALRDGLVERYTSDLPVLGDQAVYPKTSSKLPMPGATD